MYGYFLLHVIGCCREGDREKKESEAQVKVNMKHSAFFEFCTVYGPA